MLEGSLKLRLNMDKLKSPMLMTALSFWGTGSFATQSLWRDASGLNDPAGESQKFAASLTALLSGNYSESKVDMLNNSTEN